MKFGSFAGQFTGKVLLMACTGVAKDFRIHLL